MDDESGKFHTDPNLTFKHPYPATKVMFIPDKDSARSDLLATTGDFLRIWHVDDDGVRLEKLLNTVHLACWQINPCSSQGVRRSGAMPSLATSVSAHS